MIVIASVADSGIGPFDQSILDRVGRGVDELVDHRVGIEQAGDARLAGSPEVLPPTPQSVLTTREQLVEVLDERRALPVAVEEHGVVMV
ncbi:MAG: hypothetical protein NT062_02350 [Proteobacteria bacterium]|nr:hypothetical protein [Pseudomonadota bacterium]